MKLLVPAVAAGVIALDQAAKYLVVHRLPLHGSIPVGPFFSITHVRNTGAAFGVLPDSNLFFIVVSLLILGLLAYFHKSLADQGRWSPLGLALLWGGAVGNLADRVFRGSVTDFLDFYWNRWHWHTFNVADSAISVGIVILLIDGLCSPSSSAGKA